MIDKFKEIFFNKKWYIFIVIVLILSSTMITYGRYIYNDIKEMYLTSKNFYFNSDKLTMNRAIYQVDNWSAIDNYSITISLNNYKNNLVSTSSDIGYKLSYTCSNNITCSINKTEGVIYASEMTDYFTLVLSPSVSFNDGDTAWIEVVAESTYPYKKEISARFVLKVGKAILSYDIDDEKGSPYLKFNITNTMDYYMVKSAFDDYNVGDRIDVNSYLSLSDEKKKKCLSAYITLEFNPNDVLLDLTTSSYLKADNYTTVNIGGYDYVNSISFEMDAISSEVVRFYKVDASKDYTYPIINSDSVIKFSYTN